MKRILTRPFPCLIAGLIFLPSLLAADAWYTGLALDALTWSEEGSLEDTTYDGLGDGLGGALLVGYRFNGYIALEAYGYQSRPAYLKDSDTDYLRHTMVGLGPRVNILNLRRNRWTPWFAGYMTYQAIHRFRETCCDEMPVPIHSVMEGTGRAYAVGLDIAVAENSVLQAAVRRSLVWAGWDDPGMEDRPTAAGEIFIGIHIDPTMPE